MPDISGRVKKEGVCLLKCDASAVLFQDQDGSGGLERRLLVDNFGYFFEVRTASSHAEVPQFVKKHPAPIVTNSNEFPCEQWSNDN
jgi:hypothetical protein